MIDDDDLYMTHNHERRLGGMLMRFGRFNDGVVLMTFGVGSQTALIQLQLSPQEQRTLGMLLLDQNPDAP